VDILKILANVESVKILVTHLFPHDKGRRESQIGREYHLVTILGVPWATGRDDAMTFTLRAGEPVLEVNIARSKKLYRPD